MAARRVLERGRGNIPLDELEARGMQVGEGVRVASRTVFDYAFAWAITIGDRAIIAHDVRVIAHDAAPKRSELGYTVVKPVVIGARAYVGAGSIILPGATIGEGAVVGAGSLVTGDVPAGMLAVGNPARVVRSVADHVERLRSQDIVTIDVVPERATPEEVARMRAALAEHGQILVR